MLLKLLDNAMILLIILKIKDEAFDSVFKIFTLISLNLIIYTVFGLIPFSLKSKLCVIFLVGKNLILITVICHRRQSHIKFMK